MVDIIEIDVNNRGLSANCNYEKGQNTIEFEFENEDIRQKVFSNINDYIFNGNELKYDPLKKNNEKEDQEKMLSQMLLSSSTRTYLDNLADEQASMIPFCYDAWDDFNEGFSIEKDSRIQSTGKLFKAKNTVLKTQLRPENDPDNYDDLTGSQSSGSQDDVITLPDNVMTQGYSYVYGKFYKKNGNKKVYQCYRGGVSEEVANSMFGQVQVLYFYPDALVGSYFREKV